MLVLSRKIGECIIAQVGGEKVLIKVVDIKGSYVKVGIEAPDSVRVDRSEVFESKMANGPRSEKQQKEHDVHIQ